MFGTFEEAEWGESAKAAVEHSTEKGDKMGAVVGIIAAAIVVIFILVKWGAKLGAILANFVEEEYFKGGEGSGTLVAILVVVFAILVIAMFMDLLT